MKRKLIFILSLFFGIILSAKIVPLTGMLKPESITVGSDYIYIVDFPGIYIFNKADFRLVKKFGRIGEGPQEFNQFACTFAHNNELIVCSLVKALFYSSDGNYKKEIKHPNYIWRELTPVGNKFVGKGRFNEGRIDYIVLNIYDARLKTEKRLAKYKMWRMDNIIDYRNLQFATYKDKIFVKPFVLQRVLDVYDTTGEKLYSINREYEKVDVSDADIQRYHNYFRTYAKVRKNYEEIRKKLQFADAFPAIQTFTAADGKIYVVTYKKKHLNSEVLVLDLKGKLLKTVYLPLFKNDAEFYRSIENNIFRRKNNSTFAISEGKLYQILEDEDEETWELQVTDIK
jgi:outer membrane protein assembly factor BamB